MGNSKIVYNGETLMDISDDTVTPETLAEGTTAHNSNGEQITGTAVFGSSENSTSTFTVTATLSLTSATEGTLTDMSHSFVEIEAAKNSGETVILNVDINQIYAGQRLIIPLVSYIDTALLLFSTSLSDTTKIMNMTCVLGADDFCSVLLSQLATAEDLTALGETVNSTFNITAGYMVSTTSTDEITVDVSNLSSTFAEIKSAYNSGKEISLVGREINATTNDVILFNMSSINDNRAMFSAALPLGNVDILLISVEVTKNNSITCFTKIIS